ncbi:diaminopimelate epimerase [Chlorobium sp.]|jgi:diaminopimelate epimerase|uniref:diaminopimelate epimerase n=1 Tax=Chlorobium sp. TaxID=1095 RepID=UPI003C360891
MQINFTKLSGAGNDFIVIDNRSRALQLTGDQINALCTRRTGIGADGLILIEPSARFDFSMKYYNADGLPGSMCGNGGRCAAYFAHVEGVPSAEKGRYAFEANGNRYDAAITGPEQVRLHMLDPRDFRDGLPVEGLTCHYVNTGSPHAVIYTSQGELDRIDVYNEGRAVRHRTDIFPEGTNVNFLEITSPDGLSVRTFERGVEDETLACGTGAVAAALMSYRLGKVTSPTVKVKVRSGDILEVSFSENLKTVTLSGPAKIIYRGTAELP